MFGVMNDGFLRRTVCLMENIRYLINHTKVRLDIIYDNYLLTLYNPLHNNNNI